MQAKFKFALIAILISLTGCASKQYPETPYRAKLIQEITAKSGMARAISESSHKEKSDKETLESSISATLDRKKKIVATLPEDYWKRYEENIFTFSREANNTTKNALYEYKEKYSTELSHATNEELEELANSQEMESTAAFKRVMKRDNYLTVYYFQSSNKFQLQAVRNHLERMTKLDKEYNVCDIYKECWK
jgi:hypothetical protein